MKGSYRIVVQNNIVQFKLQVNRNITIIRGDSATGKSTLVDMVRQYSLNGQDSGVNISCEKECTVLVGVRWQSEIASIKNCIVFLDEGLEFISEPAFAAAVQASDNYFVIATRETLFHLPYSVKEVYGLRNVTRQKKYQVFNRIYSEFYPLYDEKMVRIKPDVVVVEDSNSGYQFFSALCEKEGIRCVSAEGNSNIYKVIRECGDETIMVVADGAVFGPEMERVLAFRKAKKVVYFLPESFEWLILRSGLIDGAKVQEILEHPYDFIESEKYFSWERFFTALLIQETKGTYLQYSKSRLNENYLNPKEKRSIGEAIRQLVENGQTT